MTSTKPTHGPILTRKNIFQDVNVTDPKLFDINDYDKESQDATCQELS